MKPEVFSLAKISDPRGNLSFLESQDCLPFEIARVFWTYDVPGGFTRGGHAYRTHEEVIIALSGSFDVVITYPDGSHQKFCLNRSYHALYLPPLTWRHMENFSTNALSLHLSSHPFDETDYIRDFEEFRSLALG